MRKRCFMACMQPTWSSGAVKSPWAMSTMKAVIQSRRMTITLQVMILCFHVFGGAEQL